MYDSQYIILKWSIQNFSLAEKSLKSPVFNMNGNSKWCLILTPKVVVRDEAFVEVRLTMTTNSDNVQLFLKGEFSVHGPLNELIYDKIFEEKYDAALNDGVVFHIAKQLFPSRLTECEDSDTYVFRCEMVFSKEINTETEYNLHLEKLSFDLKQMCDENKFCDFCICACDDMNFRVNKAVLYARSPFFADKLNESIDIVHKCTENHSYLYAILLFLYSGNPYLTLTSLPIELYGKLKLIAESWQLHDLVKTLNPTKMLGKTQLKYEYFRYLWDIANLNKMGIGTSNAVQSSEFSTEEDTSTRWKLLFERNLKNNSSVYGIYLEKTSSHSLSHNVHVEFIIKNIKTKTTVIKKGTFYYGARGRQKFGFSSIFYGNYEQGKDVLHVTCKLKSLVAIESSIQHKGTATNILPVNSYLLSLSCNLKDLLTNQKFSDIKLCADNVSIKAHKSILSARSAYFANLLSKYSAEYINVPIKAEILKRMLLYMYSAEVPEFTLSNMQEMYIASHSLKLEELFAITQFYVLNHITTENVLELIILAHEHGDIELEEAAIKFASTPENAKVIIETPKWREFCSKHNKFAMNIYHNLAWSYCNHSCNVFRRN